MENSSVGLKQELVEALKRQQHDGLGEKHYVDPEEKDSEASKNTEWRKGPHPDGTTYGDHIKDYRS